MKCAIFLVATLPVEVYHRFRGSYRPARNRHLAEPFLFAGAGLYRTTWHYNPEDCSCLQELLESFLSTKLSRIGSSRSSSVCCTLRVILLLHLTLTGLLFLPFDGEG
jgi:hypothetical protein